MDLEQEFFTNIVVHRGAIHDINHERRIGLWFVPCKTGSQYYFHVKGSIHHYQFEIKENFDPTCTASVLPLVYVGQTEKISANELIQVLRDVPIENHDLEFNGQQWIWGALKFLTLKGYLTRKQRDDGFDEMLKVVLDGSSDELTDQRDPLTGAH